MTISPDVATMDPPPGSIVSLTRQTSRTGTAVSRALFGLLAAASHTPKVVYDVATAVSNVSVNLGDLGLQWDFAKPGKKNNKKKNKKKKKKKQLSLRKLERQTKSVVERMDTLHGEIHALIDPGNAAARLLWAFRRTRWCTLLRQIESCKIGIRMIRDMIYLAYELKALAE